MPQNRSTTRSGAIRAHALLLCLATFAAGGAAISGIASCHDGYYVRRAADRTAYEASESARRAADAATVAAIELRMSNDRLGKSADSLRELISSEEFARRFHPPGHVTAQAPANGGSHAALPQGQQTSQVATTGSSDAPGADKPVIDNTDVPHKANGTGTDHTPAPDQPSRNRDKPSTGGFSSRPQGDTPAPSDTVHRIQPPTTAERQDLDIAFAAAAFLALVAVAWWSNESRARAAFENRVADWRPVTAAACASMTAIALAGTAYFGVRLFHSEPPERYFGNIPWQAIAWVWSGMVAIGLLVMCITAVAGFWESLAPSRRMSDTRSERRDLWRFWICVLGLAAIPAVGLLVERRYGMVLFILLVVIYGIFGGLAMLHHARDERRTA